MPSDLLDRLSNLQFSDVERAVSDVIAAIRAPNYFATTKKGETHELRKDLNSEYRDIRKETVKRVIAHMTIGKDVSSLFPDVLKNMQTDDLELKKLVYLYLMNYAKTQPELVILAVNTFIKDTDDSNPLIRALAIRAMGCIRVDKMLDFIGDPLAKCLKDPNPYVRKTAAIGVAKLYDLSPDLAIDHGFVQTLQDLVSDANPMVVANAVSALLDINDANPEAPIFTVTPMILTKLLVALNECTEWGQVSILTALAEYNPTSAEDVEMIVERVLPRLQHANGSVVLSAIKVLLLYRGRLENAELAEQIIKKMQPPLVTLLSSVPEMQYVALRNISLILQMVPDLLSNEIRVFFCRYTDPSYVKLEKLDIMVRLCTEKNVEQLLAELKEYANEVDVDFVRRAVRAIGRCAIKVEGAADRCVGALIELIGTGVNYVVQESVIVIRDVFRRYPDRFGSILTGLCEHIEALDEPEARGALIWMLGEYADRVPNAASLLGDFLDGFAEEPSQVQLQIITAIIKLFLRCPEAAQDLVLKALQTATQTCDNPDVRDRAYIYWRLLSTDPQAANAVVITEKPPIRVQDGSVSPSLLDTLIRELGTVASVHHRPPQAFLGTGRIGADAVLKSTASIPLTAEEAEEAVAKQVEKNQIADLLDLDFGGESAGVSPSPGPQGQGGAPTNAGSLLDLVQSNVSVQQGGGSLMDLMGTENEGASGGFGMTSPISSGSGYKPSSVTSPSSASALAPAQSGPSGMNDLMGLFGDAPAPPAAGGSVPGFGSASPSPAPAPASGSDGSAKKDPFDGLF